MSKASRAAEAAASDATLRALIIEQDARHAVVEAADRREREQMLRDFRNEIARDRLEVQAHALEAQTKVLDGEHTGRWLPAAQSEPEPVPVDVTTMSVAEYAAMRSQLGVHDAPSAGPSRRPGYTQASSRGMFDGLYADPRQVNRMVFHGQLEDRCGRTVPPGYQRPAATEDEYR